MPHPWSERWTEGKPLVVGGQGVTRLVESKVSPETGVLKYLKNNKSITARARMRREVASLQSLRTLGGNVPSVLDHNTGAYEDLGAELYLVMRFIDGKTLQEFVTSKGVPSVDDAIRFALAICKTVRIAHAEGILHRDLKPDNIVVCSANPPDLCIVDYGLSFNTDDDDLTETMETFRNKFLDLPETNTPGGDRRDPRSDVTAVCGLLYFTLTGHRPGQLQDSSGIMPHLRLDFSLRDSISDDPRMPQLELLLSQGFAPNLQSRFQSIDDLTKRLEAILSIPSDGSIADPVTTANSLSEQLRQLDRKTQLAELKPEANLLKGRFLHLVKELGRNLGRFRLSPAPNADSGPALQEGLDALTGAFTVVLSVDHHKQQRRRTYKLASRGEQSVVCVWEKQLADSSKIESEFWQELVWFEGHSKDAQQQLKDELGIWLDERLRELGHEVLMAEK